MCTSPSQRPDSVVRGELHFMTLPNFKTSRLVSTTWDCITQLDMCYHSHIQHWLVEARCVYIRPEGCVRLVVGTEVGIYGVMLSPAANFSLHVHLLYILVGGYKLKNPAVSLGLYSV